MLVDVTCYHDIARLFHWYGPVVGLWQVVGFRRPGRHHFELHSRWFDGLNYVLTVANEIQVTSIILGFWTDKLPNAAWITIFWAVVVAANVFGVKIFREIEVVGSSIKFGWIIVVIFSLIDFLSVLPTCIFAMAGSENCGLVSAETKNPRKAIPRAVGSIWLRLALFYLCGALMVTINVDPHNKDLFGASGTNASPFVIVYREAGLPALAHMMNAIILTSSPPSSPRVQSSSTVAAATSSASHISTWHRGGGLAYLNVKNSSADVFSWLSNMTSLFALFCWGMICLTHIRVRHAWHAQGRTDAELPWKPWTYPYGAWWGLSWCVILIVVEFYLAVWPLGKPSSAKNFFSSYISVITIVVLYLGARVYYRGPWWIKLADIDLDNNRRFYVADEEEKVPRKGLRGKADKVLGVLFN
ncbi:hypothetical protein BU23DRAFT_567163 [Bimuria novae-zelandiae CBS 107.79]|uniref:Amino acid permease/ SLC12A domain-containing protein n=1 Tax=Bimuria novae-zelandiae CBS 107.79 TaxID=1447943 RepID=A0A6A5VBD9_9PLEO|nr:hypothetical protein BU23DRAFT_567163 [Bimuria novae-zelandiae CBS 107.79]